jgi:hypothetical protein
MVDSGKHVETVSPKNAEEGNFQVIYLGDTRFNTERGVPMTQEQKRTILLNNAPLTLDVLVELINLYYTDEVGYHRRVNNLPREWEDDLFNSFAWGLALTHFKNGVFERIETDYLQSYLTNFESNLIRYVETHRYSHLFYQGIL